VTDAVLHAPSRGVAWRPATLFWLAALVLTFVFAAAPGLLPAWATELPRGWRLPFDAWIGGAMRWVLNSADLGLFTVKQATRGVAWLFDWPLTFATSLFATGFMTGPGSQATQILPPLSWLAVVLVAATIAHWARGWRLALFVAGCFLYLAIFGQWASAMLTLASITIAVPFGVAGGLLIGIAAWRRRWVELGVNPALDLMQTVPVFAYLVPILFLFGFGPVSAMIATIIYAMPPMVRVTILALRSVRPDVGEFGRMAGCTPRQLLWRILLPSARPLLMVGVNQVIMLTLNMVIIASMIGAGGLGFDVLTALRRLDIGGGIESGVAIVVLAVALDRVSAAAADRPPRTVSHRAGGLVGRHPHLAFAVAAILVCGLVGALVPAIQAYPAGWQVTTGAAFDAAVEWINVTFHDALEAVKNAILLGILLPVKRFMQALPWPWVALLVAAAGWRLGGLRLAAGTAILTLAIAFAGLWEIAMYTVYLCGVSVIVAVAIGLPLGIACAGRDRLWRVMSATVDVLQTLPSFVYLIPVIMLFQVGDFSAIVAIVAFAVAPAVRYAAHGVRAVDPSLVEAGIANGCTRRQILWRIRLPLALPELMLGLNQTVLLALSMLVITALVGTRDLGQEVYKALAKADVGKGLAAGLAVAFLAIVADRLIGAAARRTRHRLGLI
jgi:glycine betaine/proline transport system permease protein